MKPTRAFAVLLGIALSAAAVRHAGTVRAYVIDAWWPDGDNIVMDDVFLPAATFSSPAQFQLSEWNQVDTTDNSHPFRISNSPQFSFGADDGDNTMGFLGEAGLISEYGLDYSDALAWTVSWGDPVIDEADVMLDPALGWSLTPHSTTFFQSTVLHETGHVRGLDHEQDHLSMQNAGGSVDKILRGEVLYMDDKEAVRQHASHVTESDIVIYNKWHDGSIPQWMTVSPTTARVGQTINLNNITVENRGTNAFGSLRFGTYLSTNETISTADQLLNTGSWGSFGRFTLSRFNWSVGVPFVADCGTRYIGGIIDDNAAYAERFEGNNAVAFVNGTPNAQAFSILLERDSQEPNDSFGTAKVKTLPFNLSNLTIDQDQEQDYYRFTLAAASKVTIQLAFTHSLGDVDLQLLNSGNVVLQSSTGTTNSETIVRDLAAGTYYVRAYGFSGGSCNRYSISASAVLLIPDIDVVPAALNYGNVALGSFKNLGVTVRNTGNTTLNVSSSTLIGVNAAQFSIVGGGGAFSLAPAATRLVTVRLTPASLGLKSATLRFDSDDPNEDPKDVPLAGTAVRPADLVVSALSSAGIGGAGSPVALNEITANVGLGPAPSTLTNYYLSLNTVLDAADTLIGRRAVPALAAGASSPATPSVTIPAGTANGAYYIVAKADATSVAFESNEANNTRATKIRIGPDLRVSALTAPASTPAGGSVLVSDTTANGAASSPAAASTTSFYLSNDNLFDPNDVLLGSRAVPALAKGGSSAANTLLTIPAGTAPGVRYIVARADALGILAETNEGNNRRPVAITITP